MNSKLFRWFEKELPEVIGDLSEPAEEIKIKNLENKLKVKFPDELRELYLVYDGQRNKINTGLFYGLGFLSLEMVEKHWNDWVKVIDSVDDDGMKDLSMFCKSHVSGAVKEVYANKKWVPIAYDFGGNYFGLDFDPGQNGVYGQVINFGRDENEKYVIANSFGEFIEWYIEQLESGNYNIVVEEDGGKSFNTKNPSSGHFLDAVTKLFAKSE